MYNVFSQIKSFYFFLKDTIFHCFLFPIGLIAAHSLNGIKPQLLAALGGWGWEVAKHLLNFVVVFEPGSLGNNGSEEFCLGFSGVVELVCSAVIAIIAKLFWKFFENSQESTFEGSST